MTTPILHIVSAAEFRAQPETQPYLPSRFAADGFIHCTKEPEVLLYIANSFYKEVEGEVWILVIDPDQLTSPLKWEPPSPTPPADSPLASVLFPHIYGPLNREAILEIRTASRAPDGSFLAV